MGFSAKQVQALRRHPQSRHIRTREANGRELSYLEGWYAISEANRIFGFDGWNRETWNLAVCLPARTAAPSWRSISPGSVSPCMRMARPSFGKAMAPAKAMAPRRARCTTSRSKPRKPMRPSGRSPLSANRSGLSSIEAARLPHPSHYPPRQPPPTDVRLGFHPDDTTPIPRPSRYYGRRQNQVSEHFRHERQNAQNQLAPPLAPAARFGASANR